MTDPGYGSYIASAAEGERNRRASNQQLLKKLDYQKYGIDTASLTTMRGQDINKEIAENQLALQNKKFEADANAWKIQNERQSTLFQQGQEEYATREKIGGNITDNAFLASEETEKRDALRSGDLDADEYSGFGKVTEFWRGMGEGDAYSDEYDLNIGGVPVKSERESLDLRGNVVTPEMITNYAPHMEMADQLSGNRPLKALWDMGRGYFK